MIILGQITLTGINLISTSHLLKSTGNWMEEERERSDEGETGTSHPGFRTENKLGGEGAPSSWSCAEDATSCTVWCLLFSVIAIFILTSSPPIPRGPKIKFAHLNAKFSAHRHSCLPVFEPVKCEAWPDLSIFRYRSPVKHALHTEMAHSVGGHSAFFASQTQPWDRLQPSPCCSKTINLSSVLQMLCSWLCPHPLHPRSKGMQPLRLPLWNTSSGVKLVHLTAATDHLLDLSIHTQGRRKLWNKELLPT